VNLAPKAFNPEAKKEIAENYTLSDRARIMNKDCPFIIDDNTRLDSVNSPGANILQNNYTLLNDIVDDIDVVAFQNIFKPEIINYLEGTPETEDFRKNNATLVYKYFDKEKKFVTDIVLLPGEY